MSLSREASVLAQPMTALEREAAANVAQKAVPAGVCMWAEEACKLALQHPPASSQQSLARSSFHWHSSASAKPVPLLLTCPATRSAASLLLLLLRRHAHLPCCPAMPVHKLFIGGLHCDATLEDVQDCFSTIGTRTCRHERGSGIVSAHSRTRVPLFRT